jgi:purine-binding chemotaxis protein CheW
MSTQLVVFQLCHEEFSIEVVSVESIIKLQSITKVPHAPDFVVGVTNLRGSIVPVIDLKARLGLVQTETGLDTRIVVALLQDQKVGMIVDAVSQVIEIDDHLIEDAPYMTSSVDSSFIKGVVKIDEELVILLDLERVFTNEKTKI